MKGLSSIAAALSKGLSWLLLLPIHFYRMVISVNGVEFTAAVSENDLQGVPAAGLRLKAKGMLMGEFSH